MQHAKTAKTTKNELRNHQQNPEALLDPISRLARPNLPKEKPKSVALCFRLKSRDPIKAMAFPVSLSD
jgi:hypothetical protein